MLNLIKMKNIFSKNLEYLIDSVRRTQTKTHYFSEAKWPYRIYDAKEIFENPKDLINFHLVGENWLSGQDCCPIVILWGFNDWKRGFIAQYLKDYRVAFAPRKSMRANILYNSRNFPEPVGQFIIWGQTETVWVRLLAKLANIPIWRMEDGFLRSMDLGANHITPYSIVLDKTGLYFDSSKSSDIIDILNNHDFENDHELTVNAKKCFKIWAENRLSKYNVPSSFTTNWASPVGRKRIAILGQVTGDAALKYGNPRRYCSEDLIVAAKEEHPGAEIIFRPHPEEVRKKSWPRKLRNLEKICIISDPRTQLIDFISNIDQIYTISSLSGFEALLRGKAVTVFGTPFYAGWGLTSDRVKIDYRTRPLSKENLFATAYLLYPRYLVEPEGSKANGFMTAAFRILSEKKQYMRKTLGSVNAAQLAELSHDDGLVVAPQNQFTYILNLLKTGAQFDEKFLIKEVSSYLNTVKSNMSADSSFYNEVLLAVLIGLAPTNNVRSVVLKKLMHAVSDSKGSEILVITNRNFPGEYVWESYFSMLAKRNNHVEIKKLGKRLLSEVNMAKDNVGNSREIEILKQEEKRAPYEVNARRKLARSYFQTKDFEATEKVILNLFLEGQVSVADLNLLAKVSYQKGKLQSSVLISELSLAFGAPDVNAEAIKNTFRNLEFKTKKDLNQSLVSIFYSATFLPDSALSIKHMLDENLPVSKAEDWMKLIIANFELDNDPYLSKVKGLTSIGLPDKAMKIIQANAESDERSTEHALALAQIYSYSNNIDGAFTILEELIYLDPKPSTYREFLRLCVIAGRYRLGLDLVREADANLIPLGDMLPRKIFFGNHMIFEAMECFRHYGFRDVLSAYFPDKYIDGPQEANGSILLLAIFGPGDEIRFSSLYEKIVAQFKDVQVLISCDPRLQPLLKRSFPLIDFIPIKRERGEAKVNLETHGRLPGLELRLALDNSGFEYLEKTNHMALVTDFLSSELKDKSSFDGSSYLTPCKKTVEKWSIKRPPGLVVGLSWRSSLTTAARNEHYLSIEELAPLFDIEGVTFINLQYDECQEELDWVERNWPGKVWNPQDLDQYNDLDGVAGLIASLPLVIAPATTVVELSGALGVTTWLLSNSSELHWRNNRESGRDVWHHSIQHVEADELGNKDSLVHELVEKLKLFVGAQTNGSNGI